MGDSLIAYDKEKKLWTNSERIPLNELETSLGKWIWNSLLLHGPKIAQINDDNGVEMTYDEVRLKATRVAQNLQKRGIQSREIICIIASNTDDLLPVFLASIGLGCPHIPLRALLTRDEMARIFKKTKPTTIFCDFDSHTKIRNALAESHLQTKLFLCGDGHIDDIESVENLYIETGVENEFLPASYDIENDMVGISCSSGTTGPSKCISLSYGNAGFVPFQYDENSVIFCFHTIYWLAGIKQIIDSVYNGATRISTTQQYTPELFLNLIKKYRVTVITNTPFHMIPCLKGDLIRTMDFSFVKQINFYGGKLSDSVLADIIHNFPNAVIMVCYGMTELGMMSVCYHNERPPIHEHINNKLYYDHSAIIYDESGKRCGPNVSGEICFKNRYMFFGYYGDPVASAEIFDSEGFFRTGDIGHFDENQNLFVEGRKKDILHVMFYGVLVPSELEEFIITMDEVNDVCVVGIPTACGPALPAAMVVRKPGSNLNQCTIYDAVAANFADCLKLRGGVYFVDSLPKTDTGKFRQKDITKLASDLFAKAKINDSEVRTYLLDIPEDLRSIIIQGN